MKAQNSFLIAQFRGNGIGVDSEKRKNVWGSKNADGKKRSPASLFQGAHVMRSEFLRH
jgi:hypothetical protein